MAVAAENARCDCGKVVYVSRREALTMAKGMKSARHNQRAYRCAQGFWHLSSKPSPAKTRRVQFVDDPSAVNGRRDRMTQKRVNRAAARSRQNQGAQPIVPSKVSQIADQRDKTRCSNKACGRLWLSDLDPAGRACPACGSPVKVGKADRFKKWVRSVAA